MVHAIVEIATAWRMPLTAHRIASTGTVADTTGWVTMTFRLSPTSAALVRPDGIIAWRGDNPNRRLQRTSVYAHLRIRASQR
jgi:hypothetical protein